MPTDSGNVCLSGNTGSDRRMVKMTRLTRSGHWRPCLRGPCDFDNLFAVTRRATLSDVAQWLERLGLGQYTQVFAENDVDFEVLPRLTDDNLKELGLTLGHRVKLKAAIEALSPDESSTQPTSAPA